MDGDFDWAAAAAIRKVVEDWVVLRDSGRWDEFARVWHDDGWMTATWFQGPYAEFIAVSRSGFEHGVNIAHFLGGFSCEVAGNRAVAQTKMKIEQRAVVDGTEVDVTCSGRFYDFLELRAERWAIVRRQPIYEKDRLDLVDPSRLAQARPVAARVLPGRVPPPRLRPGGPGTAGAARPARPARSRGGTPVRGRCGVASGLSDTRHAARL